MIKNDTHGKRDPHVSICLYTPGSGCRRVQVPAWQYHRLQQIAQLWAVSVRQRSLAQVLGLSPYFSSPFQTGHL